MTEFAGPWSETNHKKLVDKSLVGAASWHPACLMLDPVKHG